jgi:hypothetical protein
MHSRRWRLVTAIAAVVALGASGSALVLAKTHGARADAPAAARPRCATALLADWSDGRIDGVYPIRCYRSALKALPSDLEVYSSAPDDIAQALSQRIVQSRTRATPGQAQKKARHLASAGKSDTAQK